MKKYIIIDEENQKIIGFTRFNLCVINNIMIIVIIILFLSSLISFGSCINKNKQIKNYTEYSQKVYDSLENIINNNIEYENTQIIYTEIGKMTTSKNTISLSKENIWKYISEDIPVWFPEYIMAQAIKESNCGKSDVAKKYNNLFGMFCPQKREHCALNKNPKDYAMYNNWQLSILDRILWEIQYFNNKKPSREEYLAALDSYAEKEGYGKIIENLSKKYKND